MSEFAQSGVPAPGTMHVDFEERVDFDRLRTRRLARARDALRSSELGALLCFDMNNIRYLTSTNIGEWARDKLMRFAVLAGDADPVLWDFGSAAKAKRGRSRPVCISVERARSFSFSAPVCSNPATRSGTSFTTGGCRSTPSSDIAAI